MGTFDQTNITGIDFQTGIQIKEIPTYSLRQTKISNLKIPASVTSFSASSLEGVLLQTIEVESETNFKVESKVLLSNDGLSLYLVPGSFTDEDELPSSIKQ